MAILWAGTSIADLAALSDAIVSTDSGWNSPNVAEGFSTGQLGANAVSQAFAPVTDLWLTEYYLARNSPPSSTDNSIITFNSPNNEALFGINVVDFGTTPLKVRKKTALNTWADLATGSFPIAANTRVRFDIRLKIHNTEGIFKLYVNGALFIDFAGDTTAYRSNTISRIGFGATSTIGTRWSVHSAVIVSDTDTRPLTFYQRVPTGNGAETAWTGDYTSVDETGINDADFVKAVALNDTETFTFAALPSETDAQTLAALVLAGRSRNAGDIQEVMGISRVGGTNYEQVPELDGSPIFSPQQWVVAVNPATGLPWVGVEVNAAQFGVKAA